MHSPYSSTPSDAESNSSSRTILDEAEDEQSSSSHVRTSLCLLLHLLLFFAHAVLLYVWYHHYENNITFQFNAFSRSRLPTILAAIAQFIGVVSWFCSSFPPAFKFD